MNSYNTILDIENILYKDKASKFIGYTYAVKDENAIKEKLAEIKNVEAEEIAIITTANAEKLFGC